MITSPPEAQSTGGSPVEQICSGPRGAVRRWRWWWNVTIIATLVVCIIQFTLETNWMWFRQPWNVVVGSTLLVMWLSFAAWLFVALPILCANDHRPRWQAPPRVYLDALRWLVWAPAMLIAGGLAAEIIFFNVLPGLESGEIHIRIPRIVLIVVLVIVAIAAGYGWMMQRYLRERIRAMARKRQLCFECGYPLHSIAGTRCPECGASAREE